MLNFNSLAVADLNKEPFKYSLIKDFIDPNFAKELVTNLPAIGNYKSTRRDGSDKTYNVVNNILLPLGQNEYNQDSNLSPLWINLIQQLQGQEYRQALSKLLELDLTEGPMEITLKRYRYQDYISSHTDKEYVLATQMIFLNDHWEESWGGLFHFLCEKQKDFESFLPTNLNSVAFVRAENSWHRVCPMNQPNKERIAIQVAFWREVDRNIAPGRIIEAVYD